MLPQQHFVGSLRIRLLVSCLPLIWIHLLDGPFLTDLLSAGKVLDDRRLIMGSGRRVLLGRAYWGLIIELEWATFVLHQGTCIACQPHLSTYPLHTSQEVLKPLTPRHLRT